MPLTPYLSLKINNAVVDLGDLANAGISIDYILEEPENWQSKQASSTQQFKLPSTQTNDAIFNSYHNSDILDLSPGNSFRTLMDAILSVNGSNVILKGKVQLLSATYSNMPGDYNLGMVGGNGDWIINMQNLTLWDCLSTTPHAFTVANVEDSWKPSIFGGYDSDEFHDYVYAPVRYRQPFQYQDVATGQQVGNDDHCSIYMLRPSISVYWLIQRAFRLFGYSINSQFMNTRYFRRLVMPWTWGDFYDINSQITDGIGFKAAGDIYDMKTNEPPPATGGLPGGVLLWTGSGSGTGTPSAHGSQWYCPPGFIGSGLTSGGGTINPTGGEYVFSGNIDVNNHFKMSDVLPPGGFDNFGLYSFDETTGTMQWIYNPPPSVASLFSDNIGANFSLNILLGMSADIGLNIMVAMEVTHIFASGAPTVVTNNSILESGGAWTHGFYPSLPTFLGPLSPLVYNFTVPNLSKGDTLKFRLRALSDGGTANSQFFIAQSGYINVNPNINGANPWQYNNTSNKWANLNPNSSDNKWQEIHSSFSMTGLQLQLGSNVNFQDYDAFRTKNFLDMFGGLVDTFDLEIQTDPITKTVTIEPFSNTTIPDYDVFGVYVGDINLPGYFDSSKVLDWTFKQDLNKENINELFSASCQQIDFNFKQDGSDAGQNIYAARNKGIYLNNVIKPKINNTILDNGIIAGVPGASRYMLPNRFKKGNTQKQNRFFSSVMHYRAQPWNNITGLGSPAPQLIAIIPENINDSSASAVTQVFEPKLAYYAGLQDPAVFGGWRWIGDPASPYPENVATSFNLPSMFAVNYNQTPAGATGGDKYPVLSYTDELVYDVTNTPTVAPGLMKKFFLRRMAIMRNGDLKHAMMRLNLNDICNFAHREYLKIGRGFYGLISINGYNPLSDESCECIFWRMTSPEQTDLDNSFPSNNSVLNQPALLDQYDLRYTQLLLFMTDIPQAG